MTAHPTTALARSLVLPGFSTRRLSKADLRQVDMMIGMLRASRWLGPVGTSVHRRVTWGDDEAQPAIRGDSEQCARPRWTPAGESM